MRRTGAGATRRQSSPKERAIPSPPALEKPKADLVESSAAKGDGYSLGMLDHLLVFRFRRVRDHITMTYREFTERMDLKAGGFTTLALIEANPGISQIDLARLGGFDQAVLVGVLDNLEERGWAARRKDKADRRRHMLEITPEGRVALVKLFELAEENEATARASLSAREYAQLDRALSKMYRNLF